MRIYSFVSSGPRNRYLQIGSAAGAVLALNCAAPAVIAIRQLANLMERKLLILNQLPSRLPTSIR